jgi:ATP-binding cassette subfamily B protein
MKKFSLIFDLGPNMKSGAGELKLTADGAITAVFNGETLFSLNISEISEASVIAGVGCGVICAKLQGGEETALCRFSMTSLKQAGEFVKLINFYTQTSEIHIPDEAEAIICPKCGRSLIEGMKVCLFCYDKMGVLKRTLSLMKPFARTLIKAESLLLASSVLYLCIPVLNRILIDEHLITMTGTAYNVIMIAASMLLARTLGEVIFIISSRSFNRASIGFANHMRDVAYDKLQRLSMSSLSKRTPGDMIRRITEDTFNIKDFLSDWGRWAIEQGITFLIVILILLFTDWKMTLLVIVPVPIALFALSRFWSHIHVRYERQWRKNSRCQSILHDIIKGIRTVKSFGNEAFEIKKFAAASRELAQVSSGNEQMWSLLFPSVTFLTGVGEFMVLYFGARAIINGTMSMGVLVQFAMYITYIYQPLRWLVSFPRWLADAMTSLLKVFEILDEDLEIAEKDNPVNIPLSGGVSLEGVTFGYKSYEPVLKDINVRINPGEMVGIVGRSGVGKSTLINLVMRLYDPNMGSVRIGGVDIRDMSPNYLHENVGVVFQDTFLFAGTIYENIAYAKPDAAPEDVVAACKAANAHEFIMNTADGYNTIVGENGYNISGGERQRLAIARAIIKNPSILILDEATSSLDVETELAIQESLDRLIKGRTTIAIAHRLSTLRNADRLIVLDKGKVAEVGTHVELLKKKGIYAKLVMAQRQTAKASTEAERAS